MKKSKKKKENNLLSQWAEDGGEATIEISVTIKSDALGNKTVLKRKINVVQKINNTVNREAKGSYFKGDNPNNYIYISGQTFRILGVDGDLAYLTTDYDIANVNYDGIENWLNEVYYEHLPKH